ncbi:hypothetical protein ATK30_5467 [Amycolatopsis echigonensis]|uniref:Uncharacterized protein n=1 Tax=Amycolatopsis echigonensis TaxID=2576905 RepID=A0A2N3WL45_9PSEU|nr:hypothetical protein ATK30_5467 [Amycolatopsis niigatensis]
MRARSRDERGVVRRGPGSGAATSGRASAVHCGLGLRDGTRLAKTRRRETVVRPRGSLLLVRRARPRGHRRGRGRRPQRSDDDHFSRSRGGPGDVRRVGQPAGADAPPGTAAGRVSAGAQAGKPWAARPEPRGAAPSGGSQAAPAVRRAASARRTTPASAASPSDAGRAMSAGRARGVRDAVRVAGRESVFGVQDGNALMDYTKSVIRDHPSEAVVAKVRQPSRRRGSES